MAANSKSLYLVGGAVVVFGLLLAYGWFVARSPKEGPRENPAAQAPKTGQAPPAPPEKPEAKDPGERILEGAERAFKTGFYGTAFKFYKDYDLRYAGSPGYAGNAPRVWELMRTSNTMSDKPEPDLDAWLEARRRLHEEWQKLPAGDGEETRAALKKHLESLPPLDGRKLLLEERLAGAEKK
jgi:hypothetical protein